MPHKWTEAEAIAVLVLAKRYGSSGWQGDSLAEILISERGITRGSIRMAIQNNLELMGLPGGLKNASNLQESAFQKYGKTATEELRKVAEMKLDS